MCQIDTYLGPPKFIIYNTGQNFISKEFRQEAKSMTITIKYVPVKAYQLIGLVERAYPVLHRAYDIIKAKIPNIKKEIALQMAVKAVNNMVGPDGLVPTLLVYRAYPRISNLDPPTPLIIQRAEAICKAIIKVGKVRAEIQVQNALN